MNEPQPDLFRTAKKAPKLYPIPADNFRRAHCSGPSCGAVVYWVTGTRFPISTECEGGIAPVRPAGPVIPGVDGAGVSHYTNCPHAGDFSGRNRS